MPLIARIIGIIALLAIAGFCAFGFLAAYELSIASERLPWQIAYGLIGLMCVGGMIMLALVRRRGS